MLTARHAKKILSRYLVSVRRGAQQRPPLRTLCTAATNEAENCDSLIPSFRDIFFTKHFYTGGLMWSGGGVATSLLAVPLLNNAGLVHYAPSAAVGLVAVSVGFLGPTGLVRGGLYGVEQFIKQVIGKASLKMPLINNPAEQGPSKLINLSVTLTPNIAIATRVARFKKKLTLLGLVLALAGVGVCVAFDQTIGQALAALDMANQMAHGVADTVDMAKQAAGQLQEQLEACEATKGKLGAVSGEMQNQMEAYQSMDTAEAANAASKQANAWMQMYTQSEPETTQDAAASTGDES